MSSNSSDSETYETKIPARLDRLPWSRFHWIIIFALGATWLLDGLEIGLVGSLSAVLTQPETLGLTAQQVSFGASTYLAGEVIGALVFGWLTDRQGRQKLFFITMGIYLAGAALTGLSTGFLTYAIFRFISGLGIGGEYAAIYSAIDELIPADYRGHADLAISGSYWIGAGIASIITLYLVDFQSFTNGAAWRYAFGTGVVIGLFVLFLRRYVPESPRWLMIHRNPEEAEEVVEDIEEEVKEETGEELEEPDDDESMTMRGIGSISIWNLLTTVFKQNTRRAILVIVLFVTQAFLYNAIYFTYALILTKFYSVPASQTPIYGLAFAAANFIGAIVLGRYFDTIGRRTMITSTYGISGILLGITGSLFLIGALTALTQTFLWCATFFFATAAASAAYLTVSEIFPMEVRAQAIAIFFAIGQAAGGVVAPALFGTLIATGKPINLFYGYIIATILMLIAAVVEWFWGIEAAQKSLEDISAPLSTFESDSDTDSTASGSAGSD